MAMAELTPGSKRRNSRCPLTAAERSGWQSFAAKSWCCSFYPQDNTETCTAEAIDFSRYHDAFKAAGAVVLGISPDSLKKHANFRKKHGLTTPLVADEAREAIEAYGVWGEKTMFGRKYMGVIRSTFLIDRNGKIARIWRSVRGFRPCGGGTRIREGALTLSRRGTICFQRRFMTEKHRENNMLRGVLLWMLGIPILIIILLWLFLR